MMLHPTPDAGQPVSVPTLPRPEQEEPRVVVLAGSLDVRTTAELRLVVHHAIALAVADDDLATPAAAPRRLVLDLADVASADETALKVLAVASRVARRAGVRLVLRDVPPAVLRLLHLTHLIRLVEVERSWRTAVPAGARTA